MRDAGADAPLARLLTPYYIIRARVNLRFANFYPTAHLYAKSSSRSLFPISSCRL